jgi:alanine-synthesizing transaminase
MFSARTAWNLQKNPFTLAMEQHLRSGKAILDLSVSNPTQAGLALNSSSVLQALCNPGAAVYHPLPRGLLSARDAVCEYYGDLNASVDPDSLILTTSTSEAYSFLFRLLCDPQDEVLIPTPSYPLFEFLATIQDVRLVPYELVYDHGWQIDFSSVEAAITARTRAVILVNPNNPTGSFVKDVETDQLNRLCQEHQLALMVDEVFFDFDLDGEKRQSFAKNRDALTFTLSGLSKIAGLPQMKVAWLVASGPQPLVTPALERLEIIADTYLSMNAPVQHAIAEFLASRKGFQAQLLPRLRHNLEEVDRQLATHKMCSRLEVEGGWYAILRVPVTRTDEQLAIELLEQMDVLVHPGHFFDFQRDGYLILSLITPESTFAEGLSRLLHYVALQSV